MIDVEEKVVKNNNQYGVYENARKLLFLTHKIKTGRKSVVNRGFPGPVTGSYVAGINRYLPLAIAIPRLTAKNRPVFTTWVLNER